MYGQGRIRMSKLSVAEAAEKFKVSKEAIHNRIRRGSLDCVIEHGNKYVLIDEPVSAPVEVKDTKYNLYIEEENRDLKQKVKELEQQNLGLREQKEEMLIQEKEKIEQIYRERDEQLKQVLHTITSKFLPHMQTTNTEETVSSYVEADDIIDSSFEVNDLRDINSAPMSLKSFLKIKKYKPAKHQRIKNRFKRLIGTDDRIVRKDGKIYIDPVKHDYQDLLE